MQASQWKARAGSVLLAAAGLFAALCVLTYQPADVPWLSSHPQHPPANLGGALGVWVGFAGRALFGWASLVMAFVSLLWARRLWRGLLPDLHVLPLVVGALCFVTSLATLCALVAGSDLAKTELGGLFGFLLAQAGTYYLGWVGTALTVLCVGALAWCVVSGQTLRKMPGATVLRRVGGRMASLATRAQATPAASPPPAPIPTIEAPRTPAAPPVRIRSTVEPKPKTMPSPSRHQVSSGFQLPSLDLLTNPPPLSERAIAEDLQRNARVLEETLREFGIEATVVNIDRGPAVTRYELTPAPGVKLTKIVSLADDLALVMKAANCHVMAPIPGRGTVGVDVPNTTTTIVYLKEILASPAFANARSPLALPIGKDVSGEAVITDLRECPHLLIAGATGSGKTVCLNSILVGILTHATPEQVKFLMVDPKMVELALFNDIPHLVAPVVTSPKKAAVALNWAVQEMERRYKLLAQAGVRNMEMYNRWIAARGPEAKQPVAAEPTAEEPPLHGGALAYIVVVIDELADLMMIASQDVEHAITRLAQLSRAVGIHVVLATQRPSVDVITGVIKANFPARIAFQVASKVDSRTILDMNGADKLLGRGDLLFLRPGTAKPIRAQGAFVTDAEIERVTAFLKQQRSPQYDERLLERARQPESALDLEKDELYAMAKQLVMDTGQASTSLLQRRLRLGYGRAARMLDLMEQEGVVGPPRGSRPREVLAPRETMEQEANR